MPKIITPKLIKETNRHLIYHYIYEHSHSSQQDIFYNLHLSRPTVASKLEELEKSGLICRDGVIESDTAGRKAAAYSIVPDHRIAIGVEITRSEFKIIGVDLYGQKIKRTTAQIPFSAEDSYFKKLADEITSYIKDISADTEQILGIGFSMQALSSPDGRTITYGQILNCTGLSIDKITQYLPYRCAFFHDAASAATDELWVSKELQNAVYLSLSYHFSTAIISNRQIQTGKHGHGGTIEHIAIIPGGKKCYCGKIGCAETVCSLEALLGTDGDIDAFFQALRGGSENESARWKKYLDDLALTIGNAHLFCDLDYILGGYLAPYLNEDDLEYLYDRIAEITPFEEERNFLSVSKSPKHSITIGAALPFIQEYLEEI